MAFCHWPPFFSQTRLSHPRCLVEEVGSLDLDYALFYQYERPLYLWHFHERRKVFFTSLIVYFYREESAAAEVFDVFFFWYFHKSENFLGEKLATSIQNTDLDGSMIRAPIIWMNHFNVLYCLKIHLLKQTIRLKISIYCSDESITKISWKQNCRIIFMIWSFHEGHSKSNTKIDSK